ncbi:hypothetical protein GCM10023194_44300 [Planotetraspora phitsanulokensis]|uniref:Uncharacterized protein n=1 Tax=Planotetraspora phitsanulokensis TaxID=575192 RepID=A0A8J3XE36_9ACTN|nr:hypothetical protein [Planotetraspora phitsanulokensis]GII38032.1 hypothetical protein Pph01_30350 [Planotetraspora phitsanulokensis]
MGKLWLAALLFMAVACGETPSSSASPEQPTGVPASSDIPVSSSGGATPSPSFVTPVGHTINPRKVPWISATPTDDGTALDVVWWSGVEPCNMLDRVDVTETAKTVTVTLWEGHDRRQPDAVCIEIAIKKQTRVQLPSPLGGREVVDGAR